MSHLCNLCDQRLLGLTRAVFRVAIRRAVDSAATGMALFTRLMLSMIAAVIVTISILGVLSYRRVEATILPAQLQQLQSHTNAYASDVWDFIENGRTDAVALRTLPAIGGIIDARLHGGV